MSLCQIYQLYWSYHIVPLGKQHLHEESVVRGVALHVLEIKEVLSALSHLSQVGQETQQLVEFILKYIK